MRVWPIVCLSVALSACTFDPAAVPPDSGGTDAEAPRDVGPSQDAGDDAQVLDVGAPMDAGRPDADPLDAGFEDARPDATPDAMPMDAEVPDAMPDAGPPDTGVNLCGDGILDAPQEACDDGNQMLGDGCEACAITPGFTCVLQPSRCVLDADVRQVDGDSPLCADEENAQQMGIFCNLEDALDVSPRPELILVASATYAEALDIDGGPPVMIVAEPGTTLTDDKDIVVSVRMRADVLLSGFRITSAVRGGVKVENRDSRLTLLNCEVGPTAGIGVETKSDSFLTIDRCHLHDNEDGGLYLDSNAGYDVSNLVIHDNGAADSDMGGVRIKKTANGARFTNVSLTGNRAGNQPGGIRCEVDAAMTNVIVWNNAGLGNSGISMRCEPQYSLLQAAVMGVGNVSADPIFVDAYMRLGPGSPALDSGDPAGVEPVGPAPKLDFDGRRRPALVDMGATERP